MTVAVTPSEDLCLTALRTFLIGSTDLPGALPAGVEAVLGQVNRVASPKGPDYAIYWPLRRTRLGTNLDETQDAKFVGSIAGTLMTITEVDSGAIKVGSLVFGVGVAAGTTVVSFGSGHGGVGTYIVSPSQTFAPGVLSAGTQSMTEQIEWVVQIDVHGPNSGDNAQRISTLFRDDFGARALAAVSPSVAPVDADDPKQIPYVNDQEQYEDRYVIEATMTVESAVTDVPQQFADEAVVGLINVDASYPP